MLTLGNSRRLLLQRSHRYPTPFKSAGSTTPFWYSVDAGPAHIIFVRAPRSHVSVFRL